MLQPLRSPTALQADAESARREADCFDRIVREGGHFNPFADSGWRRLELAFDRLVGMDGGRRVLDIGCGTGQSLRIYRKYALSYVGVDLSAEAIRVAAAAEPAASWVRANACDLPFPDASFDLVAFSSVLHHIPDFGLALREAHRVLRPGGSVFAFDPNLLHPAMALFRHPRSPLYLAQGVSPNERPLLPHRLRLAFEDAGFVTIKQRCQSAIAYRQVAPRLLNLCLGLYNSVDWLWDVVGLGRWFGAFVITSARKGENKP